MLREIVKAFTGVLFVLTLALAGIYFGHVYKDRKKLIEDEKCYKNIILRVALFTIVLDAWLLVFRWDKAVNTVGFVGIYITLITLCSLAAIQNYKRIFMVLSIIMVVMCITFIGLDLAGKGINDSNDLAIASLLGIIFNIIAIVWSIHEPNKMNP